YRLWKTPEQSCMYWSDDHFERISCNQKKKLVLVIAFDSVRYHDFKKITKQDTITYAAIGHVWYSKKDNELEYYTSDGYHPVRVTDHLKPITAHIIDTHLKN